MSANAQSQAEKKRKHNHPQSDSKPAKKVKKHSGTKSKSKHAHGSLQSDAVVPEQTPFQNGVSAASKLGKDVDMIKLSKPNREATQEERIEPQAENKNKKRGKIKNGDKEAEVLIENEASTLVELPKNGVNSPSLENYDSHLPKYSSSPQWTVSAPIGGLFCQIDPVYSLDERHLLLATSHSLNVYSISTSLLVRQFHASEDNFIAGFALSIRDPDLAIIANSDGAIHTWNWTTGETISSLNVDSQITAFDVTNNKDNTSDILIIITATREADGGSSISMVDLSQKAHASDRLVKLHESIEDLQSVQVFNNGRVIFAASQTSMTIGTIPASTSARNSKGDLTILKWKTFGFPEGLSCFHARYSSSVHQGGASSAKTNYYILAIASNNGAIYVYENILSCLRREIPLTARRLHWHRNRVGAIKWSRDGNYLISGGLETVLVLWQMETNNRQELPNLTASIQNITVSPSGKSYALRLGDNSALVLSTSELAPIAVVAGLQSRSLGTAVSTSLSTIPWRIPAISNLLQPSQILLAVPATQDAQATPFLQTFDLSVGRHVARQALARSNVININQGPKGQKIDEASVNHIQTSLDGQWLASSEDWEPPVADLDFQFADDPDAQLSGANRRRETYLKFWQWNSDKRQWALEARVDSPHHSDTLISSSRILDLVSIPNLVGFTSIGEDSVVRVWQPKTRLSNGKILRGVHRKGVTTWACLMSIDVGKITSGLEPGSDSQFRGLLSTAKLAYSADGSVLAVAPDSPSGIIHFFDAATGTLHQSQACMYSEGLGGLQFLDRYLIVLSKDIHVWDTITNKLAYGHTLSAAEGQSSVHPIAKSLAVNEKLGSFAVTFQNYQSVTKSRVLVFDTSIPRPLLEMDVPNTISTLITLPDETGFAAVDIAGEIRCISPKTSTTMDVTALGHVGEPLVELDEVMVDAEDESLDDEAEDEEALQVAAKDGTDDESDFEAEREVVRAHQLAKVFEDSPSFAMPPMQDLFHAVASLYLGKQNAKVKVKSSSKSKRKQKKQVKVASLPG